MTGASLKVIVAWSDRRNLCSLVRDSLGESVEPTEVMALGDDATVVYTADTTAEIRDTLRERMEADDNLLVAEFEVWSSLGEGVDARWLLARGH